MKKLLSLLLALALLLSVGAASAENAHINAFLTRVFTLIGGTDLDSRTLRLDLKGPGVTVRLARSGGVTRLSAERQGQETLIELNREHIAVQPEEGRGYLLRFSSLTSIANSGLSMLGLFTGMSYDKLENGELDAILASLAELPGMLLEKGLAEEAENGGTYAVTLRLTVKEAVTVVCDWIDKVAHDPVRYKAWCKVLKPAAAVMNRFAGQIQPAVRGYVTDAVSWFTGLDKDKEEISQADRWAEKRAEMESFLYGVTGAGDERIAVDARLTLEHGDFAALRVFGPDGAETAAIAYEGSDLILRTGRSARQVRVRAENDRELIIDASDDGVTYGGETRVLLTEGGDWQLTGEAGGGFTFGSEPASPFEPLSPRDDGSVIEITDKNLLTLLNFSMPVF